MAAQPAAHRGVALTGREIEVLELAGRGLSMKGMARLLRISDDTVKWHLKNAYQKLQSGSREEALRKARERGLVGPALVCPVCAGALVSRH